MPDGGEPAAGPDAPTALRCDACGAVAAAGDPYPFRCPNADSDPGADHLLGRLPCAGMAGFSDRGESNPFVRFRRRLRSHSLALARGLADADFVALARSLDEAVAAVDRRRFVATPFAPSAALAAAIRPAPGEVWAKDETGNVSGSHKARHLMGIALHLEVAERTGLTRRAASDHRGLAIASCGNAALAAAVVARAAARPLTVYIPTDADPRVVSRLDSLAARIVTCERRAGETGDPCLHAFRAATAAGAIPFCCQGSENGLTIEGGMTLGWEIAGELAARGAGLDRLFVQVGGGALASATAQALEEAAAAGALPAPPRLHAVQTLGAFPLRRAYERVRARAVARLGEAPPPDGDDPVANATWAERLLEPDGRRAVAGALAHATRHRAQFMWPWETTPASVAHGILDDETYDWRAVVSAMLATGGWPVTVDESTLREARGLAVAAGIRADATGAAGLAGLIALRRAGLGGHGERTAVLFTGVDRATETP